MAWRPAMIAKRLGAPGARRACRPPLDRAIIRPDARSVTGPSRDSTRNENGNADPAFSPGDLVAERFLVTRLLGAGGLGEVYEVMDQALGSPVALKVLKPAVSA